MTKAKREAARIAYKNLLAMEREERILAAEAAKMNRK